MNLKRSLLTLLLAVLITQAMSGELFTEEELDSLIESDKCYMGVEVQAMILEIIRIADEEIQRTSREAVKEAVVPLQADIHVLNRQLADIEARLKEKDRGLLWIIPASIGGGLLVGFILGGVFL